LNHADEHKTCESVPTYESITRRDALSQNMLNPPITTKESAGSIFSEPLTSFFCRVLEEHGK
jgi:hypothetical protein